MGYYIIVNLTFIFLWFNFYTQLFGFKNLFQFKHILMIPNFINGSVALCECRCLNVLNQCIVKLSIYTRIHLIFFCLKRI